MIYISYTENLVYVYLNTYKDYYTEMFLFFKILDYCMFYTHTRYHCTWVQSRTEENVFTE